MKIMYAKITKSGNKLLINIPKEHKEVFSYLSPVKIISLKEEEENEILPINNPVLKDEMKSYEAVKIIKDLDRKYNIDEATTAQLIKHAKQLLKGNEEIIE